MFEFDLDKSESNHQKHGIDFYQARELWLDPDLVEIQAKNIDEARSMFIGKIDEKHWSAITTYRDGNIRLISVRRSRNNEKELYESRRFR
ncbi:BrnT family toxin [Jiulongibacter sediminis]|uniref:BrnT family toxin n=1 Tax=Jiulongibacter sediminis TaxID=1605367 RepID=UPI0026EEEAC7|nr:BrnT family toxin [Jiulongibacter sediminis]